MYKKLRFVILAIIFALSLSWYFSTPKYNRSIKKVDENYPNFKYQSEASLQLKKLGVRHKIGSDGSLQYNSTDEQIVQGVYNNIEKKLYPNPPNIRWAKEEHHTRFIEFLKKEKILYEIKNLDSNGKGSVYWDPIHDAKVRKFNAKMMQEITSQSK